MAGEELNELQMPHSVSAEQAVLGSMLVDESRIPGVIELLKADDFYMRQNRDLYQVLFELFSHCRPMDMITVVNEMTRGGAYEESAIVSYIEQLMLFATAPANVLDHAKIVAEKSLLRQIGAVGGEITELVRAQEGTADQILAAAEQRIYALRQGRDDREMSHISSILDKVYSTLRELQEQGGEFPGISTGLIDLDRRISGLNNSDLIILAARPGVGKSSLAMNIGVEAAKHSGKSVAVFSLEMSKVQLGMRILATEALIDNKKLSTGRISGEEEWERVAMGTANLSQAKLYIDDNATLSVADINARCRRMKDLGLVVIDYLQLMTSAGETTRSGDNRQQVVSDMSRALKLMAKELDVPVICLSQLSRANESRTQRRPLLSDLRDSGAIEQDADIVMFLYRESYYDNDTDFANIAEVIVAKNRHGETGTVKVEWRPEFTLFRNLSDYDDDDEL